MKKQTTPKSRKVQAKQAPKQSPTHPPTWSVKGPNWTWEKKAPHGACPMEIATQALEDIWSKDEKMQNKIKESWLHKGHDQPTLGLSILVSHDKMKSKGQHILVCSITALANAGHHKESNELRQLAQEA